MDGTKSRTIKTSKLKYIRNFENIGVQGVQTR